MDKRPVPILDKDASSIEKPRQPEQKQDEVYGCENWMEDAFIVPACIGRDSLLEIQPVSKTPCISLFTGVCTAGGFDERRFTGVVALAVKPRNRKK